MSLAEQVLPSGRPPSPFYTEEHEAFRSTVRRFVEREIRLISISNCSRSGFSSLEEARNMVIFFTVSS